MSAETTIRPLTIREADMLRSELTLSAEILREAVNLRCWQSALEQSQRVANLASALLALEQEGQ